MSGGPDSGDSPFISITMVPDLLTVNGFTFCADHGNEYCYLCTYDFRNMNNDAILDELDEEVAELLSDVSNKSSSKRVPMFIQTFRNVLLCSTSTT